MIRREIIDLPFADNQLHQHRFVLPNLVFFIMRVFIEPVNYINFFSLLTISEICYYESSQI